MTLAEALETVELEPGRIYRCRVHGQTVEVRIVQNANEARPDSASGRRLLTKELCEEDIMLDAWCELPGPTPKFRVRAKPGPRLMPDIPEIPRDEDVAE